MFNRTYTSIHLMCIFQFECSLHCLLLSRSRHDFGSVRAVIILLADKSQLKVPQVLPCKWLPLNVSSVPPPLKHPRFDEGPSVTQRSRLRSWFGAFPPVSQKMSWIFLWKASPFLHSSCLAIVERLISLLLDLLVTLTSCSH